MSAMNWTIKAEQMDCETGCRNAKTMAPSDLYYGIYNDAGYGIATIDRLGRIDAGGDLAFSHEQVECNDEPHEHATTDEQWQSIINTLAAAPEMLAALKNMVLAFDHGDADSEMDALRRVKEAIAKAEPPRIMRHRVSVTVEVTLDATAGEASAPGNVIMAAVEAVRDGEGTIVAHEIVGQC